MRPGPPNDSWGRPFSGRRQITDTSRPGDPETQCALLRPTAVRRRGNTADCPTLQAVRRVANCVLVWVLLTTGVQSGQVRQPGAGAFEARVVAVIDGDTIDVLRAGSTRATRIRIEGIDAPERGEPFSDAARRFTRTLLFDKRATVHGRERDRYGRLVARVSVDGNDAGVEIVKAGLACHYVQYSSDTGLAAAEGQARTRGRGFWAVNASRPQCARSPRTAPVTRTGSTEAVFHGNTSSRVYHAPSCRNYNCQQCTRVFTSEADAQGAGFRPAGDCLRR